MKHCKRCLQSDTRPKIFFDVAGVCGACLWEEEKLGIDWRQREEDLQEIAEWAKEIAKKRGIYDCVVGVSGGKDSMFQALYARDKLGLNCLLVNAMPAQITQIGQYNIGNLSNLGFDMFTIKCNPIILRKLIKRDFYKYGNISKPTEFPLWSSVHHVALAYNIPLIVQGENDALTLGIKDTMPPDGDASQIWRTNTLKGGNDEYIGFYKRKDLLLYQFPNPELLRKAKIKSIWLNYYVKEWSQVDNARFAIAHGLKIRNDKLKNIGRIHRHTCLDSDFHMVNQMFKYYKYGFGFATDEVCYDIREGRITREDGIKLIEKYDGKCSKKYINNFCNYIGIDKKEFWRVVDGFVNKDLFKKANGKWLKKNKLNKNIP